MENGLTPGGGGDKQNVTHRQTECSFIYIDVIFALLLKFITCLNGENLRSVSGNLISDIGHDPSSTRYATLIRGLEKLARASSSF